MLVSSDIKFIRRDQEKRRNGEACRAVIENTMLVSFDIKFIRRDQKQRSNGETCRSSSTCFWSSLINLISKDSYVDFYLSCIIRRLNGEKIAKQMKRRRNFVRTC